MSHTEIRNTQIKSLLILEFIFILWGHELYFYGFIIRSGLKLITNPHIVEGRKELP